MDMICGKYYYFLGSLYFLFVWTAIFLKLKRYRKKMILCGLAFWIGLIAEYFFWTRDWWHPTTITGTRIGIEDVIMCFTHLGIPIFIYKGVFQRETQKNIFSKYELADRFINNFIIYFISFLVAAGLIFYFKVHSFAATFIGMVLAGSYIALKRKDLFSPMVWSGVLVMLIAIPPYRFSILICPGAIEKLWNIGQISGIMLLGIPLEDLIWYWMLGFILGGAYEYLFEFNLLPKQKNIPT